MNKFKLTLFVLTTLVITNVSAQEAELQLDSIVIIDNALSINKVPSRSWDYEGYDTVNLNLNSSQVVTLRHTGITVKNSSNSFGADVNLNGDRQIYNLLIRSSSGHNFFDITNTARNASRGLEPSDSWIKKVQSRSTTFHAHPNQFISPGEKIIIEYIQEMYSSNFTVRYRLELLYYSID